MFTTFCSFSGELHAMPRRKVYDRLLITWSHTELLRQDVVESLEDIGAVGGIVAREPHSEAELEKCTPELRARPFHLHAAIFGNFPDEWKKAVKDKWPDCSVFAQHTHVWPQKQANGQPHPLAGKFKATFGFKAMVKYLTAPEKDKVLDDAPLFFGCESKDQLLELYTSFQSGDTFAMLDDAKDNGVDKAEVIFALAQIVTKENAHMYRIYLDYFDAKQPKKEKLLPDNVELYPWQKVVVGFAQTPLEPMQTSNVGLWICDASGKGKSVAQCAVYDNCGTFIPSERANGGYDSTSMWGYDPKKHQVILFNDLNTHTETKPDGEVVYHWKKGLLKLLKACCDLFPLKVKFGPEEREFRIRSRVVVSSNYPLPKGYNADDLAAFLRRFIEISSCDDIVASLEEHGINIPEWLPPTAEPDQAEVEHLTPPVPPHPRARRVRRRLSTASESTEPDTTTGESPRAASGLADLADWQIESPVLSPSFGAPPSSPPGLMSAVLASRPQQTGGAGSSRGSVHPRPFVPPRAAAAARPRVNGCQPGFYPAPLTPRPCVPQREVAAGSTPDKPVEDSRAVGWLSQLHKRYNDGDDTLFVDENDIDDD